MNDRDITYGCLVVSVALIMVGYVGSIDKQSFAVWSMRAGIIGTAIFGSYLLFGKKVESVVILAV